MKGGLLLRRGRADGEGEGAEEGKGAREHGEKRVW